MSRMGDPYRSSSEALSNYGGSGRGGGANRWDTERLVSERDRVRFATEREERDSRFLRATAGHTRERSYDDVYERRGPRGYEEEREHYEERDYYDSPRFQREPEPEPGRKRPTTITMERERERERDESPPRRAGGRPAFLRRQSSLDTFDRKPLVRYEREREMERDEYGPPARRPDLRPPPLTPVSLPRGRGLPPPRRYAERDYEDIKVAEPDFYGDEDYRAYPEIIREREIVRRRRRSHERRSHRSHSKESRSTATRSVRSESASSSDSGTTISVRSEFPKKGKTRMPARLVSKKAIIDLDYPFEEEGDTIIIQKALGRENIDEVIKLSEQYKTAEKLEMSGGRSEAGTIIEERTEVFNIPPPPSIIHHAPPPPPSVHYAPPPPQEPVHYAPPPPEPVHYAPQPPQAPAPVQWAPPPPSVVYAPPPPPVIYAPPPPPQQNLEIHETTRIVERSPSPARSTYSHHSHHSHHTHHHHDPVILEGRPRSRDEESVFYEKREIIERIEPIGAMTVSRSHSHRKDERSIRAEIKALEAEKEALKADRRANRELRRAERLRREGARHSDSQLVLYEDEIHDGRDVTIVRRERIVEPEGGVRIEKDRKAPPPKLVRAMLATLT
ncbi:d0d03738-0918-45ef-8d5f-3b2349a916a3 [Sclerotinia trifoliorum]|uniref:D0d03738-0918-45ef-8d5f-3b2349a916a3 n=1 Tax=Sclerotinia trifoliorum TaxID=28548 RepID=A0A8H2W0C7_9HELO|nr:d0d03738-0918-45ef-8d5f-3b2349a916a3 [Sclerotinia trifoliorum]